MDNYNEMAKKFLEDTGTKILIRKLGVVQGFPNSNDQMLHDKYSVTLKRGEKKYSFPFYGSEMDHYRGKRIRPYDVLAALQKYEVEPDMWDFADEYGFEINSKESYNRVKAIHKACKKEYANVVNLFGDCMERLCEIA